jgi:hypothetical protein
VRPLRRLLPEDSWRVPTRERPDPSHVRAFVLVLVLTAAVFVVFWIENVWEARHLTPDFVHSIVSQVLRSSLAELRFDAISQGGLLSPRAEFTIMGYSVVALWEIVGLLTASWSQVDAMVALRQATVALNLAGAPLLFLAARRAGMRAWPAALVALLYLFNPALLWRISWDLCGWQGTMLIGAYLCLQRGRHGAAWLLWIIAAGGHPFATWGVTLWCAFEWLLSVRAGRESRTLRIATLWFVAHAGALFFMIFILPLFGSSFSGEIRAGMVSTLAQGDFLVRHALQILWLLGTFWLLPLRRLRWSVFMIADVLYYLVAGIDHGLIPSTVGMLSIATLEGCCWPRRVPSTPSAGPGVTPRLTRRWLAAPAPIRGGAMALAVGLVLATNLAWHERNHLRRFALGRSWDGDWIADARALATKAPRGLEVCVVQAPLFPILDGACGLALPWHDPAAARLSEDARPVFALHVGLLDAQRYRSRFQRQDERLMEDLCRRARQGELEIIAEAGGALLLGPAAGDGAGSASRRLRDLCGETR